MNDWSGWCATATRRRRWCGGRGSCCWRGDGLTADGIAAAVGKSLLTVRRWRRRYVGKGVDGLAEGRDSATAAQAADGREDQAGGGHDAARDPAECDALERAHHGGGSGHLPHQRPADLARARAEAAFDAIPSRSPATRTSSRRSRTSSGLYFDPPDKALVLWSTKRAKSRRSTAPSRACR